MDTVGTLITAALQDIGIGALGEPIDNSYLSVSMRVLNNMLDSWGTEGLMVFNIQPTVYTMPLTGVPWLQGPGGTLPGIRSNKIVKAYNRDYLGNDFEIYVTDNLDEYSDIVVKNTPSNLVQVLYVSYSYPLNEVYAWPLPTSNQYSLVVWQWETLGNFTDPSQSISLPPGYAGAIEYNLAVELAPKFGRPADQSIMALATKYKAQVKRINSTTPTLDLPDQLMGRGYSYYDFIAGR